MQEQIYPCPQCGAGIRAGQALCGYCGLRLDPQSLTAWQAQRSAQWQAQQGAVWQPPQQRKSRWPIWISVVLTLILIPVCGVLTFAFLNPGPRAPRASTILPYTELDTYTGNGRTVKNILVAPGQSEERMVLFTTILHSENRNSEYQIWDDDAQFNAYILWDIHYPDDAYPYPEEWSNDHMVGRIQKCVPTRWCYNDQWASLIAYISD